MAKKTEKQQPVSPVNGQPLPKGIRFTKDDERARNAGRKSGKVRAERKSLREELLQLLAQKIKDEETGEMMTTQASMSMALILQALAGNTKAFEIVRDTIGEKPVDNLNIVSPNYSALEKAFSGITDVKKRAQT